jgi:V/A-type H+-transporting ATPase subunit C
MASGVSGYAAINARVRVMFSTLHTPQELSAMVEAADFSALITQLKHTAFGPYLDRVGEKDLTPRRAVFEVKGRLSDSYGTIIRNVPKHARGILLQMFRYFEVDNLKAVLRGIVTGATWDRVRFVLYPEDSISKLPAQEMVEAGNIAAAVELLRGTPYYESLSHAMKRYSAEQNLFPLEVALDLDYWRELWKDVNELPSDDRIHALKIIGALVDMNNLMWAIRYRVYHRLSEEEVINYTLPFGYHVRDADIRAVAAGADIAQVVKRVYPDLENVDDLLQEPWDRLQEFEQRLKRQVVDQCLTAFVGNPFHVGLPLAYLVLSDYEIQDLTVLLEAKAAQLPLEEYRPYLVSDYSYRG